MKAIELINELEKKLGTDSQSQLADALGVSVGTLINWKNRDEDLSPRQVATALAKSRMSAVRKSQLETIRPIVEFYPIDAAESAKQTSWLIFNGNKDANTYSQGVKQALSDACGIYIFYDSRGQALYVGKAREQSLWKEMNLAFNRHRGEVQKIKIVSHPERNKVFKAGYEKLRQPKDTQVPLLSLASYFSAYQVDIGMIDDLEALMVRGFANNLLNIKMETFAHSRA